MKNLEIINKLLTILIIKVTGRRFYGFNNRFRTTKNTEAIVFENGGFVGNLGLVKKNYGRNILKLFINIELIQVK